MPAQIEIFKPTDELQTKNSGLFEYKRYYKSLNKYLPVSLQLLADIIAVFVSFWAQYYIRFETGLIGSSIKPDFSTDSSLMFLPVLFLLAYWLVIYFFAGLYRNWYENSPFDEIFTLLKVNLFGSILIAFFIMSDSYNSPRMLFLVYFVTFSFSAIVLRTVARRTQRYLRFKGFINYRTLLVGTCENSFKLFRKTRLAPTWAIDIVGVVKIGSVFDKFKEFNLSILDSLENLENHILNSKVDTVLISSGYKDSKKLMEILHICANNNVRCQIETDLFHIFTGQTKAQNMYGMPLIEISLRLMKPWEEAVKRGIDIVFSLGVIILGLPFWILFMLIISIESKGNPIFIHDRVGKDGRIFRMVKFRSMVQRKDVGSGWTAVNDKRVTKFGRFLRKTHLDEIPQFLNVLIGDMSIVGPRPEQKDLVAEFSQAIPYYRRRLSVRPGITGWWQVKYTPYEMSIEEVENRLKDDFYYIENMSLRLDIEIIIRTVWCVIKGHGQA